MSHFPGHGDWLRSGHVTQSQPVTLPTPGPSVFTVGQGQKKWLELIVSAAAVCLLA